MTQHTSFVRIDNVDDIERLGLLTKAVSREADRRQSELLRPLGITPSQAEVLQLLALQGPLSLGELGNLVLFEGGHPSRLVDRLVSAGLLERTENHADRRRIDITCTARGRELAHQATLAKAEFRTWVHAQLRGADISETIRILGALIAGTGMEQTVAARSLHSLAENPHPPGE